MLHAVLPRYYNNNDDDLALILFHREHTTEINLTNHFMTFKKDWRPWKPNGAACNQTGSKCITLGNQVRVAASNKYLVFQKHICLFTINLKQPTTSYNTSLSSSFLPIPILFLSVSPFLLCSILL